VAEIPAFQARQEIDADGDQTVSPGGGGRLAVGEPPCVRPAWNDKDG
jgi:hypothetical protein